MTVNLDLTSSGPLQSCVSSKDVSCSSSALQSAETVLHPLMSATPSLSSHHGCRLFVHSSSLNHHIHDIVTLNLCVGSAAAHCNTTKIGKIPPEFLNVNSTSIFSSKWLSSVEAKPWLKKLCIFPSLRYGEHY